MPALCHIKPSEHTEMPKNDEQADGAQHACVNPDQETFRKSIIIAVANCADDQGEQDGGADNGKDETDRFHRALLSLNTYAFAPHQL